MASGRLSKILRDMERHKHIFDLDRDGLGEALMGVTAGVILRAMDDEVDYDGSPWAALSSAYVEFKSRVAPGKPMAVLYGHMKTEVQIKGESRVTDREAVQVYGVDDQARELATFFQEGNARQPPRRFYGLSAEAEARLDECCRNHLESLV